MIDGALRGITGGVSSAFNNVRSLMPTRGAEIVPVEPSRFGDFCADGQDPKMVAKLLDRVKGICTSQESPLYMAVQQRPVANFSPDAVVLTNLRFIVFVQKVLGRLNFYDYPWRDVKDVHLKEDLIGATISFLSLAGGKVSMDWLPKEQARKLYRIAQQQEQDAYQHRRELMLEEKRASAAQTQVNTTVQSVSPTTSAPVATTIDPVAKLSQLKQMLDADLIEQEEYDATKKRILEQMC